MPRVSKADEWSEKQKQARNGFRTVVKFAVKHKRKVIIPIWDKAAQNLNMSVYNMFVRANRGRF